MTLRTTDEDAAVTVRAENGVDEETLGYARTKVDAVLARPGLPVVTGEVRIAKAAAPHIERPWSATANLRVGRAVVVVHAREATGREVADRLQDRMRRQVNQAAHSGRAARGPVVPPWRGGHAAG
ncbi:hypothetical protein [Streptomyces rugosispiralis]|uniref:Uncharacterized protein n=1 Tax=Streptomyces rugosispiralis TaxID=2967341 RepID=A0ABT1UP33_9ACTN|nr:hypothetical protein [Streptomyces rugosispiralis]MCQ8186894.1 hypothetical protein [Streptomyces rugosispiralis]